MNDILLAFVTGLTTGGLSCLAVQGGLLAGSIAHEVEQNVATASPPAQPATRGKKAKANARTADPTSHAGTGAFVAPQQRAAKPIVLFLAAKVVAYTTLGFLLGLLGSYFRLSPSMRVALQLGIGIFMVGNALRMLNVHPIFRYFALEPPRFVTRYVRRKSKSAASNATPLFLGALTILIPCGVTQAMMAVAMASGSAVVGATTMFAFTLGTTPVFFALAYLATRLGQRLEKGFMTSVAVVVLVLGLISIDSALTLGGFPYSVTNMRMALAGRNAPPAAALTERPLHDDPLAATGSTGATNAAGPQNLSGAFGAVNQPGTLVINVSSDGYSPQVARARANEPLKLNMVSKDTYSCARALVIPSLNVQQILPETGTVTIDVPPQAAGSKLFYSCSMGMYSGVIEFEG